MNTPFLLFADKNGTVFSHPYLRMAYGLHHSYGVPHKAELMQLPKGSTLFYMPNRHPVGYDPISKNFEALTEFEGKKIFAVAAFTIPAILRLHLPAVIIGKNITLPLWAYTACGHYAGKYYLSAKRIDRRTRQSPQFYNANKIKLSVQKTLKQSPRNRLYQHLAHCALNYNCLAAKNLFLGRWEAPIPTARSCNARCLGCLSEQKGSCIASHQRIDFRPQRAELVEVMANHLRFAKDAICSFGQGCEGEPLLEAKTIAESIAEVRTLTQRGTINMNTNASDPKKIRLLCEAGIDSFRVSLNSPDPEVYRRYFRPRGYIFSDLIRSIAIAKKYKKFVSLNLFIFPGFSDTQDQITMLIHFIRSNAIDMIQWRNLNIDPAQYQSILPKRKYRALGILSMIERLKKEFPKLKHGYFNLHKDQFT